MYKASTRTDMPAFRRLFIIRRENSKNHKLVGDTRRYRIKDLWGDEPCSTPCAANTGAAISKNVRALAVSEPKYSRMANLPGSEQFPTIKVSDESLNTLLDTLSSNKLSLFRRVMLQFQYGQ